MRHLFVLAFAALCIRHCAAEADGAHGISFEKGIQPVLKEFCQRCHFSGKSKGGVSLDAFTNGVSIYHDIKLWQKVSEKLAERDMPPEGKPQPTQEQRDQIVQWIHQQFQNLDEGKIVRDPGRVLIHRLSRLEYNNTVRDLLGVDLKPADHFPSDGGGGGGFDNNADTLFVPPILMERYLDAAAKLMENAREDHVFFTKPSMLTSKRVAARRNLEHFASRAFRRPARPDEIKRLLTAYDAQVAKGVSYEESVKSICRAVLVSPSFLFRVEEDKPGQEPYPISDFELASRLSYFLWSSMPDDQLFETAARGDLHKPEVLEAQTARLLKDPRAKVFAENFVTQWLRVRDLKTAAQPDQGKFPEFTRNLRDAMYQEVVEDFNGLLQKDESVLSLLESRHTWLNEDLARHYGIPGIHGTAFREVALTNSARGGVLGMAAVLTLTSYPLRTSPVLRGKWVLEEILGTPPPPPPSMVKSLPQDDSPKEGMTLRQRLEKHRSQPECASCHKRMDPLGFGLENFDPIGRWRTQIGGEAVDASGVMPGGEKFTGPAELKKVLLEHKDEFVRNLTEKMLAYALGRGLEYYDIPAVRLIARKLEGEQYRSTVLISEIVKSFPFQYRRNDPPQMTMN